MEIYWKWTSQVTPQRVVARVYNIHKVWHSICTRHHIQRPDFDRTLINSNIKVDNTKINIDNSKIKVGIFKNKVDDLKINIKKDGPNTLPYDIVS